MPKPRAKVVLVGFTRVSNPRYKRARLPPEVIAWSADKIPRKKPTNLLAVKRAYYDLCIGGHIGVQLERLFGHRVTSVRNGIVELVAKMDIHFPEFAKKVENYLAPEPPYQITDPEVYRKLGRKLPHTGVRLHKSY